MTTSQDAVGHVLDDGLLAGAVLEADGVADVLAQLGAGLVGHALRHRHGGHAARLRAPDHAEPKDESNFNYVF